MGSYPDSNSYFYVFKSCTTPFTVKIAFLFLTTRVLFIRPGCIAITCESLGFSYINIFIWNWEEGSILWPIKQGTIGIICAATLLVKPLTGWLTNFLHHSCTCSYHEAEKDFFGYFDRPYYHLAGAAELQESHGSKHFPEIQLLRAKGTKQGSEHTDIHSWSQREREIGCVTQEKYWEQILRAAFFPSKAHSEMHVNTHPDRWALFRTASHFTIACQKQHFLLHFQE